MKSLLALALLIPAACFAGSEMPCAKIEYAQLKDSSKEELNSKYCVAVQKAQLNADLAGMSKELFDKQLAMGANPSRAQHDMSLRGAAQSSCVTVSEDVAAMLKKKYKAGRPSCS